MANLIGQFTIRLMHVGIVIVLEGTLKYVQEAIKKSGLELELLGVVSFPANGQQENFRTEMQEVLKTLKKKQYL